MKQEDKDRIIKKLIETHTTISTMESCTSGMIASMITDTEGASGIFPGGYVTYLNETKVLIGVNEKIIKNMEYIQANVLLKWRVQLRIS